MTSFAHSILLRILNHHHNYASRRCGWWSLLYYAACTDDIGGFWRAAWAQLTGREW